MAKMPLFVGIDLGTSNSTVSVFDGTSLTVVRNRDGGVLTPSVVRIDPRGHVSVGTRARRFLDADPANTHGEFKRLLGTAHNIAFPASASLRRPEELSAEVLKSLRQDVADQMGVAPDRAVISVPALFELHQTAATSEAARLAGFERIELIQEPVASAIAAGWTREDHDGPWMVYDLGGGTFDVSLLETRDGLLRVVGHDGDNFLGGRDFDRAIVDLMIEHLAREGVSIDRANRDHGEALRRLRFAAEEAKIEMTRATEVPIVLDGVRVGSHSVTLDMVLSRSALDLVVTPLIDRSIEICERLMAAHGISSGALERLVLVGGPTVTPVLRDHLRARLGVGFGEGLDPMTLVSQGAALFAGTVALDGRPQDRTGTRTGANSGPKVWLQFPPVTSDLWPFVVGRLLARDPAIKAVGIERADGGWRSEPTACEDDGAFAIMVSLLPRQTATFTLWGHGADGGRIALDPAQISIAHGLTLGDPPLSRSVGVALADNHVQVYFDRGSALPIRRTFTLLTAETIGRDAEGYALKVPIVQGEFASAHHCRLVGTLEIPASALAVPLPAGTEVAVMIELDRGGQLRARAHIPTIDQVFDEVAFLVTPQVSPETMAAALERLQARATALSRLSFRERAGPAAARLSAVLPRLDAARRSVSAAQGGDGDAAEQARRELSDCDAVLAEIEADQAWPELARTIEDRFASAVGFVAVTGTADEKATLNGAYRACKAAFVAKHADEVRRQLALIDRLGFAACFRQPGAWDSALERCAAEVADSTDIRRATELVAQGRLATRHGDRAKLENIVRALWDLSPVDRDTQALGHGSGLRAR